MKRRSRLRVPNDHAILAVMNACSFKAMAYVLPLILFTMGCSPKSDAPSGSSAVGQIVSPKAVATATQRAPQRAIARHPDQTKLTVPKATLDESPFAATNDPQGPVVLIDAPDEGSARPWIQGQLVNAARAKQSVMVYVGAVWCEPCERFKKAAQAGELNQRLPGLRLLVFDADKHGQALHQAGYRWRLVPLFVRPTAQGGPSHLQEAGVPSQSAGVANIVPRLRRLLRAK